MQTSSFLIKWGIDSERLKISGMTVAKRIAEMRKKAGLSQAGLADLCGWGRSQNRVSNYEQGRSEPSYSDILKIAQALNVNPAYLAFGAADERDYVIPAQKGMTLDGDAPGQYSSDDCLVPPYVKKGKDIEPLRLSHRVIAKAGASADKAAWLRLSDNSMEPLIPPGSTVVFDTDDTEIQSGQAYAVEHGGLLRVKLVYLLPKGAIRLRSHNEAEWPDEIVEGDDLADFMVLGRVFWYSVVV